VGILNFQMVAAKSQNFHSIEQNVNGLIHVAALDDHGACASSQQDP
jgi:hypothetical protein